VASSDNKLHLFLSDQGKLSQRLLTQSLRQSSLVPQQEREAVESPASERPRIYRRIVCVSQVTMASFCFGVILSSPTLGCS
jgi:hypothetical protein